MILYGNSLLQDIINIISSKIEQPSTNMINLLSNYNIIFIYVTFVHFVNSYLAGLRFDTQHHARTHICKKTMYNHCMCLCAHICIYRFFLTGLPFPVFWGLSCAILLAARVLFCVRYTFVDSFPGYTVLTEQLCFCVSSHCLLVTLISKEKPTLVALLFLVPEHWFFSSCFEIFYLVFIFHLTMWYLDVGLPVCST